MVIRDSGIDPDLIAAAAKAEGIDPGRLEQQIRAGRVVIPANPKRSRSVCPIGEGCRVKVNVNVGTSQDLCDPMLEQEKAQAALDAGAHTLMDLSTGGDLPAIRRMILTFPARLELSRSMKRYEEQEMSQILMQICSLQ